MTTLKMSPKPLKLAPPLVFRSRLQESELRYRSLLTQLPVGVYRSTPQGRIVEMNPALTTMLGYTASELKRLDVQKLYFQKIDRDHFINKIKQGPILVSEFRLRKKSGGTIWVRDYCRAVKAPGGAIDYFDGILVDITREKKAEDKVAKVLQKLQDSNAERQAMIQRLESFSVTDDLTGLYNRRGFFMITKEYLNLAVRKKLRMYLLFIDMDDLKVTNDTYGHHVGDEALRQLSQILKSTFRSSDIKGRMGGDEFAVFPIDSTVEGVAAAKARLAQAISAFNESGLTPFKISISTGVSCFEPDRPMSMEDLLKIADKLMYEQKAAKRKR
jgi:diguanylate cyclase (GGDEF)-like protein/PAS domain S-box-containing protein